MSGITLDAGGLIALDRNDRRKVVLLARAAESRSRVTIPASALSQAVRSTWYRSGKRCVCGDPCPTPDRHPSAPPTEAATLDLRYDPPDGPAGATDHGRTGRPAPGGAIRRSRRVCRFDAVPISQPRTTIGALIPTCLGRTPRSGTQRARSGAGTRGWHPVVALVEAMISKCGSDIGVIAPSIPTCST